MSIAVLGSVLSMVVSPQRNAELAGGDRYWEIRVKELGIFDF